jgi:hypothetical protein
VFLCVKRHQDVVKPDDRKQLPDARGRPKQVDATAVPLEPDVGRDQVTQTGRVEVRDVVQIDNDLDQSFLRQPFDDVLEITLAGAAVEFARQLEHGDVSNEAFDDLHDGSPCLPQIAHYEHGHVVALADAAREIGDGVDEPIADRRRGGGRLRHDVDDASVSEFLIVPIGW